MSRIAHAQQVFGGNVRRHRQSRSKERFPDAAAIHRCLQEDRGQHAVLVASGTTKYLLTGSRSGLTTALLAFVKRVLFTCRSPRDVRYVDRMPL